MRYDVVRMNGTNRARTRRTRFKVTLQSVTLKTWNIFLRLTNNRKRVNLSTYDLSQPNQRKKHNSVSDGIRPRLCNTMFYCNSNAVA